MENEIQDPVYVDIVNINDDGSLNVGISERLNVDSEVYTRTTVLKNRISSAKKSNSSFVVYYTGYYTGGGRPQQVSFEININIATTDDFKTIVNKINLAKKEIETKEPNLVVSNRRGVKVVFDLSKESPQAAYKSDFNMGRLRRPKPTSYIGTGSQSYL